MDSLTLLISCYHSFKLSKIPSPNSSSAFKQPTEIVCFTLCVAGLKQKHHYIEDAQETAVNEIAITTANVLISSREIEG